MVNYEVILYWSQEWIDTATELGRPIPEPQKARRCCVNERSDLREIERRP